MKIQKVIVEVLQTPVQFEYAAAGQTMNYNFHVLVRIRVEGGIEGIGFNVITRATLLKSLAHACAALGELLIGMNALDIEACRSKMEKAGEWFGPGGMISMAISPLDIALWDIKGKVAGMPLYRLLGACRDRVPTYASDEMWYSVSTDELVQAARRHVAHGFDKLKLRLGHEATIAAELRRVRAVQDAVGPDIQLMVDIAEVWGFHQAVTGGRALQEAGIMWLEDPVNHQDEASLAHIAQVLDIPVTGGEHLYGLPQFSRLLEARAVDVAIIDLGRVGGITPWLKVAGMAEAKGVPIAGHVIPEVHAHLLAAIPNGHMVEYMPRSEAIFKTHVKHEKSCLLAPTAPGIGLELDEAACAKYKMD